jgi:selenocysteine-specific elongation factor
VAIGADELIGKAFLNDNDPTIVQLRFDRPAACALDQPLIIRRHSPPDLLGGGRAIVPVAVPRKRTEKVGVRTAKDDATAIREIVDAIPDGVMTDEVCRRLGKTPQVLGDVFEREVVAKRLLGFGGRWFTPQSFALASERFLGALAKLHEKQPSAPWQPRDKAAAAAGLDWTGKPFDRIVTTLVEAGRLTSGPLGIRLATFQIEISDRQRAFLSRVLEELAKEPVNTPNAHDLTGRLHVPRQAVDEVLKLGALAGEIIELEDGVLYTPGHIARLHEALVKRFAKTPFTAAEARDALATSRKYIIPLLEHMDKKRLTVRVGDKRVAH